MKELLRSLVAGVVGSLVTVAVVAGHPALAAEVGKATAHKVTSAAIKNGTVKKKDLNAELVASLGRADTALQRIPADAVTGVEVTNGSLTTADVAKARGSVTFNLPDLDLHECVSTTSLEAGTVLDQDLILVSNPAALAGVIDVSARQEAVGGTALIITWCNTTVVAFDPPPATYSWVVIEN